ncbi:MAG: hypothetical protein Q7S87_03090 [Agitococcus sp.]|nr:hypothetical protein [Agitococcus sp.]MDO9177164.1 hypothetical protein [Agitococcus sp.]
MEFTFNLRQFKTIGTISHFEISADSLIRLATHESHLYPGQRDHASGFKKKTYLRNILVGETQEFGAVYIVDEKRLELIDGYHRVFGISLKLITPDPAFPYYLKVHTVPNRDGANKIFEQCNNLSAAKKSTCWFQSGLNECGKLRLITSGLVMAMGKATAVQYAAGLKGSAFTKEATVLMIDGLVFIDALGLFKNKHEFGGSIGVYYAAAVHCNDKSLVERFVRNVNGAVFNPSKLTKAEHPIKLYHEWLTTNPAKSGGIPSEAAFSRGLAAFAKFVYAEKRKTLAVTTETINLAQFVQLMKVL